MFLVLLLLLGLFLLFPRFLLFLVFPVALRNGVRKYITSHARIQSVSLQLSLYVRCSRTAPCLACASYPALRARSPRTLRARVWAPEPAKNYGLHLCMYRKC
jgi:hypothetical protein